MTSREFFARLCRLLCELDKLVKEYFLGAAGECSADCHLPEDK